MTNARKTVNDVLHAAQSRNSTTTYIISSCTDLFTPIQITVSDGKLVCNHRKSIDFDTQVVSLTPNAKQSGLVPCN